jgi:predicted nuclease with TOPRIM domain
MDLLEDIFQKLCDLQKSYEDVLQQNLYYSDENNTLKQDNLKLKTKEEEYINHITSLCNTIQELESERLEWRKVSSIVCLEKQNNVLKNELEILQNKLQKKLAEKTIKGVTYYIDKQDLFIKNPDESIGDKVGYIHKKDNKTIVTWL